MICPTSTSKSPGNHIIFWKLNTPNSRTWLVPNSNSQDLFSSHLWTHHLASICFVVNSQHIELLRLTLGHKRRSREVADQEVAETFIALSSKFRVICNQGLWGEYKFWCNLFFFWTLQEITLHVGLHVKSYLYLAPPLPLLDPCIPGSIFLSVALNHSPRICFW